jgi:hypothetical protein
VIGWTPPPLRGMSGNMWALHPSHEQPTKFIVSLPTFNGKAHLPTHALHCYVQEDWPIAPKNMKLWRLLKIEGSVLIYIVLPLGPTSIGERRTTFAKAHGLEVRCLYGEHVGEHIVNLGTH